MKLDKLPDPADCVKVEVQVMNCIQDGRENLIGDKQMAQVRTRIDAAYGTSACGVDGIRIILVLRMFDHDVTALRKQPSVAGMAGRHHTVEHIHTAGYGFDYICRSADAHQV